jgi:lipid biosynthesis B12-binding/radical SAM protein
MSKVFLISANLTSAPYPVYPLGMAVVASALNAAGHDVVQADLLHATACLRDIRRTLEELQPDYIGISMRNLDNVDSFTSGQEWYLDGIKLLIEQIRGASGAPIILGGPGFSLMPDDILNYTGADYGVTGEGEQACCDLLEALNAGRKPHRIVGGNEAPLGGDDIRPPLWEKDLVDFYLARSAMVNIQTKRGCPCNCIYCSYPKIEGAQHRCRDPRAVVDDIERLQRDFGVAAIFWADSIVNDPDGHCLEVAAEILRREVRLAWYGFFRPTGLGRDELATLKQSGLSAMEIGTDAATDDTLEGLHKSFSFDDVVTFHRVCVQLEIPTAHYVIFGGPFETTATVNAGLKNLKRLERSVIFAFSGIRIHPGTGLHALAVQQGILSSSTSLLRPVYYVSPEILKEDMDATVRNAFRVRRNSFFPPSEGLLRLEVMNRFGYKGLLWDKLIRFS